MCSTKLNEGVIKKAHILCGWIHIHCSIIHYWNWVSTIITYNTRMISRCLQNHVVPFVFLLPRRWGRQKIIYGQKTVRRNQKQGTEKTLRTDCLFYSVRTFICPSVHNLKEIKVCHWATVTSDPSTIYVNYIYNKLFKEREGTSMKSEYINSQETLHYKINYNYFFFNNLSTFLLLCLAVAPGRIQPAETACIHFLNQSDHSHFKKKENSPVRHLHA